MVATTFRPSRSRRGPLHGEARASGCLDRYERRFARAIASVINVVDPDVIVLGGGLSNIPRLYDRVPALWSEYVFSDRVATSLRPAKHGDASGVRGAAWLWRTTSVASASRVLECGAGCQFQLRYNVDMKLRVIFLLSAGLSRCFALTWRGARRAGGRAGGREEHLGRRVYGRASRARRRHLQDQLFRVPRRRLDGDGFAPALTGADFQGNWNDLSVGDLFERIRISMPPSGPTSVTPEQKADIVAHIFNQNKYPAGKTELEPKTEVLKTIKIELKK